MAELEKEVLGNVKGIRNTVIEDLKTIYDMEQHDGQLLSIDLAVKMAKITKEMSIIDIIQIFDV